MNTSIASSTWTVHKFGGTSVGTAARLNNVADIIACELKMGLSRPCIVSSAMSSIEKSEGTTTRFDILEK
jgi:aspartate kinase